MVILMLSLYSVSPKRERPQEVAVIVAVCGLLSAIAFVFFPFLLVGEVPLFASVLGAGMEQLGPVGLLLYGVVLALLGLGLWMRWRGSRRAAIALAAIGVVLAVPAVSRAVADGRGFATMREGLQIVLRVIVIFYLSQEPVKEWFAEV